MEYVDVGLGDVIHTTDGREPTTVVAARRIAMAELSSEERIVHADGRVTMIGDTRNLPLAFVGGNFADALMFSRQHG